ncbi:hypothetical protein ABEF95_006800 [Exophiala dermatitidis]
MAPRVAPRRQRDNVDYSAIGKLGRRTGVTLEQRPLDANGMEEISGMFSSPRKQSPLKKMTTMENVDETSSSSEAHEEPVNRTTDFGLIENRGDGIDTRIDLNPTPLRTPASRGSTRRRSVLPPRSISPRKTGISGTARKSDGVDIFSTSKHALSEDLEDRESTPEPTPSRNEQSRRITASPPKTPLRDIGANGVNSAPRSRRRLTDIEKEHHEQDPEPAENGAPEVAEPTLEAVEVVAHEVQDFVGPLGYDDYHDHVDDEAVENERNEQSAGLGTALDESDVQQANQTFEPERSEPPSIQNQANSRRKRKSDVIDEAPQPSPTATKKRRGGKPPASEKQKQRETSKSKLPSSKAKAKAPPKPGNPDVGMSSRQQQELDEVIAKVRARPDPPRSLYILRRETPADDTVTHTRSGRVSIKPLAYWRNERCVYGGSPNHASLDENARFPLNSIKEIVRTEELDMAMQKKQGKRKTKKTGRKAASRQPTAEALEISDSDTEMDEDPAHDPHAEPWETETGTLRGLVSVWDQEEQAPLEEEEEVEIAHAPGAIKVRDVKGSSLHEGPTFRYAKLLSTNFFGTGLVELPPGGVKRPKNSRRMHMSFFVVKGRVTVTVGPVDGEASGSMSRFSIGKGGFWQVPRGNQYSIANELDKTARIFFSQGCETSFQEEGA